MALLVTSCLGNQEKLGLGGPLGFMRTDCCQKDILLSHCLSTQECELVRWGGEGGGDLQWTVIPSREVSMHIHTL